MNSKTDDTQILGMKAIYDMISQINDDISSIENRLDNIETHEWADLSDEPEIATKKCQYNLDSSQIIITPINQTYKSKAALNRGEPCSKRDWDEQMKRHDEGKQMMWDDTPQNKSKKGDIFCVCFNKSQVGFHQIEDVKSTCDRLPSWSNNVGQRDRKVIYISAELAHVNWIKWLTMGGAQKVQGTTSVKQNHIQIVDFLKQNGN
jgi:hypothetical protein